MLGSNHAGPSGKQGFPIRIVLSRPKSRVCRAGAGVHTVGFKKVEWSGKIKLCLYLESQYNHWYHDWTLLIEQASIFTLQLDVAQLAEK